MFKIESFLHLGFSKSHWNSDQQFYQFRALLLMVSKTVINSNELLNVHITSVKQQWTEIICTETRYLSLKVFQLG